MSLITQQRLDAIEQAYNAMRNEYAPYDTMPAFAEGERAYFAGCYDNPHTDVAAQAWDRGLELSMRVKRKEHVIRLDWMHIEA